jgi:hypothetical protein
LDEFGEAGTEPSKISSGGLIFALGRPPIHPIADYVVQRKEAADQKDSSALAIYLFQRKEKANE